jgi:hypothetical protein
MLRAAVTDMARRIMPVVVSIPAHVVDNELQVSA